MMLSDPTYQPPAYLKTIGDTFNILQLTDLHLYDETAPAHADFPIKKNKVHFLSALDTALAQPINCDLILVTGDLVSEVKTSIYDDIYNILTATDIPFACIAGNHDVTDELYPHLPFEQRKFIAKPADKRLLEKYAIHTDYWQILLINSSLPGLIAGSIDQDTIAWLTQQLTNCDKPAVIALHHHVLPMRSAWIDEHNAKDADNFWQHMRPFKHLKAIVSGHTHQQKKQLQDGISVFSTPATSYQFKPLSDAFAVDSTAKPGYRWLQLQKNGDMVSWVERVNSTAIN